MDKEAKMVKNLTRKERLKRNLLKAGELAKKVGVLYTTIDYYTNIGLIEVVDYTQGKYRLFKKDEALARIARIKELKDRGLTLDKIKKKLFLE